MFAKTPRLLLLACVLCPSWSWALGLGEIHLESALNEPLRAEIDLVAATPEELTALRATLAGRDSFSRYGIDRPQFLNTLTFKVGKSKDNRDVLLVSSTDSIPEPFVTFLVEVNWSRGRLMREYTLLLDPPVYSPGETAGSAPAVAGAAASAAPATAAPQVPAATTTAATPTVAANPTSGAATATPRAKRGHAPRAAAAPSAATPVASEAPPAPASATAPARPETEVKPLPPQFDGQSYTVKAGDTLSKIAHSMNATTRAEVDQTMMAVYQSNPRAFGANINILRQGAILRIPGADDIAALNQKEAISEVSRQMSAWREGATAAVNAGHLRLVTPSAKSGAAGGPSSGPAGKAATDTGATTAETLALQGRVKDLETQLADSRRLLDLKNGELADLQRRLGVKPTAVPAAPTPVTATPVTPAAPPPAAVATTPAPTPTPPPPTNAPAVENATPASSAAPIVAPATPIPAHKPSVAAPAAATEESWLDWLANNWWIPAAIIVLLLGGLGFAAFRRRQRTQIGEFGNIAGADTDGDTELAGSDTTAKILGIRKGDDSFVVEESGEHPLPDFAMGADETRSPEDTLSSESAVNLDQGDPLAEADFHMAYGLYDQAADLVRIALEREPDRRDLRLKLLEIYFVWGNKDAFLQTAKTLEATRDRAPAGEWDKIVIMGKQICPDEPLFSKAAGGGRGAGALVDLNLEGGENRIDIDLFGDPEGERSFDHPLAKEDEDTAATGQSPQLANSRSGLDFTLDTPERGADDSPTREMPPRDEPTVESELMAFHDSPTQESPALKSSAIRDRIATKLPDADHTAEVSIDDLGLDLDGLDEPAASSGKQRALEETDHPDDAPTMVAGLDERSRRMMAEAESRSHDKDLTELERELEASFISELESSQEEIKTAVIGPESAPTVHMPRDLDIAATSQFKTSKLVESLGSDREDLDSTSKLRGINADSIDLDLDRLASALGNGDDTREQPRAAEEVFSTEVFEASQRSRRVDLDVGEALNGSDALHGKNGAANLADTDDALPEFEPVTMSEVGTKLDLARAYMDMGDPEGARNILDEVVQEGSASQKQEAQRLIQALPG
jgi:pilus assembly protein FimV